MEKDTKWSVDQTHSQIYFQVKHLMISNVKGSFKKFDASIHTTAKILQPQKLICGWMRHPSAPVMPTGMSICGAKIF